MWVMGNSSNMDIVLVLTLIIAIISTGHSNTQVNSDCYKICPRGYHKVGDCANAEHRCERCGNGTYTEKENSILKCMRCETCGHYEMELKPCTFDGNVVCDCKKGYYNANHNNNFRDCQSCRCTCKGPDNPDYFTKCQPCKSCRTNPECKSKCEVPTTPPSTNTSTATFLAPSATPSTTSTTSTSTRTTPSDNTSIPDTSPAPHLPKQMTWLSVMGAVVTFLVLFWLLLLFTRNPIRYPDSCPCWNVKPPVVDPRINEQPSHHGSGPTSLTINISEEMPMMALSQNPATPGEPQHIGHLLPDVEQKVARQAEQSEHWPAIVLYAIIKEVPLRRWKEFLRLLSVADQQLERVELEAGLGLGSMERQYQMLRLWSQRSSASLNDIFSALHYMDLSGCAQLLQESLDKLQGTPDLKHGFTEHGFNGAAQYT